jgi:hypothetical protein
MASAKIHIKVGGIEIDYEGDSAFLEKDLLKMVQELQKVAPTAFAGALHGSSAGGKPPTGAQTLTTKSIATKLSAKSGSDVAEAAVAHLAIIKGMATFKRSDINDAMKSAAGIYKSTMTSNLSAIIQTLLNQDTLVETGTDTYALTPAAESKLKERLGIG